MPTEPDDIRTLTITGEPREAKRARAFARACLDEFGCSAGSIDDGELIISELATNAIAAAPGKQIDISIFPIKDLVAIYVYDPADGLPRRQPLTLASEKGRGLAIVRCYSHRHGTFRSASGGKVVWAMVRRFS
ncbi:ATP-binding protein [Actinoallomurus soli]|uniref:ATP-binding protein n=1 Tax=Actinoallomurus soli TaxID=2952535 RepID=UPI0020933709|nr:ATP-binding protein [Actinoallomurus soli]MCO5972180.1 ATP-binding protein [Actinoallomurus soli]